MLSLEKVTLSYEGDVKALNELTICVDEGECILLTGQSGSGKSSIVNSINGLAPEYENARLSGSIKIDGRDIKNLKLYEISSMIASVFQNPKTHFFNINTTLELLFYLENIGLKRDEMDERMDEMLKIFPIAHLLGRSIFELSGGEKQILCVASCYISGCSIIVLDEPSSNLDEKYIDILKSMLKILKNKGITLIIAEHRIYYLTDIADRIFLIQNGNIKREFDNSTFVNMPNKEFHNMGLRSAHKEKLTVANSSTDGDLTIKKMHCSFGEHGEMNIENMSFSFCKIYGIVGKNGCGKSTFLRCMTGLDKKNKSEILLNGVSLSKKDRIKNSSVVMQDVNHQLFSNSIVKEVGLGIKNLMEDKVQDVLLELALTKFKDRHPMSLSGGQKQRVAIASVVCRSSKFIFFDEPTSGMDYYNMMKISNLIKKMIKKDNMIFIISHDVEFLNATVDEVVCLEDYRTYM